MKLRLLPAFFALALAFWCRPLFGQPLAAIPDDAALRVSIKDAWLTDSPAAVLKLKPVVRTLAGGGRVQVRTEARGGEFAVVLAREWNGSFPGWGQGSWILTRSTAGGNLRLRIFLHSDPNTYIQFRPMENPVTEKDEGKSLFDVVLYEAYIVRGQASGIPFENLLTMSLADILGALGDRFPRRYFEPDSDSWRDSRELVSKVRAGVRTLNYADDGAIDENGDYVFIKDGRRQPGGAGLNCSGFAKWFADGILSPLTGKLLPIEPLKASTAKPNSSLAAHYTESREPLFGLDWTRNLAMEVFRAYRGPALATVEEVEVRSETFAAVIDRRGGAASARSYPGFLLGAGFGIEGLKPLLYTLAINEPGFAYLASVNAEIGPEPRMRQHYHIACIIPYFNEYGTFQTAVFESAEETSLNRFVARYPGQQVNLVRIPIEGKFNLP